MTNLQNLFELNIPAILLGLFIICSCIVTVYNLIIQVAKIFGIKLSWIERKNKDHQELKELQKEMQKLNKKLDSLEERTQRTSAQQEDMVQVIQNISTTLLEINKKNDLLENGIRQTVADRVEQRIKAYNAQGYILDTEYDSFCDFADYAVETLHCNHGLKRKYEDCKENIEVLSLEEVLKRKKN